MSENNDNFNMDSLLDGTLDDLADLPEFKRFPAGAHKVAVTITQKKIGEHPAFELKMKYIEPLELNNTEDIPPVAGAEDSVAYMMDNEFGQGAFKKILASAAETFGPKSNRELLADLQNAECAVVTKLRPNKDKTQSYTDIVELKVL